MSNNYHEKYIPEVLKEQKPKKAYGASILEMDERDIDNDKNNPFKEETMTDKEIKEAREMLKQVSPKRTIDKVSTDAITGVKASSTVENNTTLDEHNSNLTPKDIIDKTDKKNLTVSGINLLKDLLGVEEVKDGIITNITSIVEEFDDNTDIDELCLYDYKDRLDPELYNKIIELSEDNEIDENEAFRKFINQLYASYQSAAQYNDDVCELYELLNMFSEEGKNVENMDFENASKEEIDKITNKFKTMTESLKKLDSRNKKLKNDYKVDDFDVIAIESVKKCYKCALNFEKVYDKLYNNKKKLKKDLKDTSKVNGSIEKWINDIRTDPKTLYTFPVNDHLTLAQSREQLVDYFKMFMIYSIHFDIISKLESDNIDVDEEYLVKHNFIKQSKINKYKRTATAFLYILSKTFKTKKIVTNDDRRVLSYTLDIISKISEESYMNAVICVLENINKNLID